MRGGALTCVALAALLSGCAGQGVHPGASVATPTPAEPFKPPPAAVAPAAPAKPTAAPPLTPAVEKQVLEHIARLRAIKPAADKKLAAQYNKELEEAWSYFIAKPESLVVLRRTLTQELALKKGRSDFLLLDLGYFLHERGTPADKPLARNALYALNLTAPIVRFNHQELFEFSHAVARDRDPRILAFLDRAFLRPKIAVRLPEADLTLDPATTCAMLYGAYGDGAEAHLAALLKAKGTDKALAATVRMVLEWISSPPGTARATEAALVAERSRLFRVAPTKERLAQIKRINANLTALR